MRVDSFLNIRSVSGVRASAFALLAAHGAVRVDGDRSLAQAGIGFCTGRIWYNTRRTRGTSFPIGDPAAPRAINRENNSMVTIEIHNLISTYNYRRVNRYMFVSSSVRRSIGFFPIALPSFCLLQHIIQTITPFSEFCVQSTRLNTRKMLPPVSGDYADYAMRCVRY